MTPASSSGPLREPEGSQSTALSHQAVVAALNEWGSRGFFHSNRVGDRLKICECVSHPCQVVRLRNHYERRSETTVTEVYRGGAIDSTGVRPGTWDIQVAKPDYFVGGLYKQVIPHTDRVFSCDRCGGAGDITCGKCNGRGKTKCLFCGGQGSRLETKFGYRDEWFNGERKVQPYSETVWVTCNCQSGYVRCPDCGGKSRVQCRSCSGYGELKSYELLTVVFGVEDYHQVAESPEAVAEVVATASGSLTYEKEEELILAAVDIAAELEPHAVSLINQASRAGGKVLRQRLTASVIPVTEVIYKQPLTGTERSLWIYGKEGHVLGDRWLLTNWWAVLAATAGAVCVAAGTVMFVMNEFGIFTDPGGTTNKELRAPTKINHLR